MSAHPGDGDLEDILRRTTNACQATAQLLAMASDEMVATLRSWIPRIGSGRMVDGRENASCVLPCGTLRAREDNLPGITIWLDVGAGACYQMGTLWLTATRLPDTLIDSLPGRRACEIVEMHPSTPDIISQARVIAARHTGNRQGGVASTHVRIELDVERWAP